LLLTVMPLRRCLPSIIPYSLRHYVWVYLISCPRCHGLSSLCSATTRQFWN
jgi:hypothetical protein